MNNNLPNGSKFECVNKQKNCQYFNTQQNNLNVLGQCNISNGVNRPCCDKQHANYSDCIDQRSKMVDQSNSNCSKFSKTSRALQDMAVRWDNIQSPEYVYGKIDANGLYTTCPYNNNLNEGCDVGGKSKTCCVATESEFGCLKRRCETDGYTQWNEYEACVNKEQNKVGAYVLPDCISTQCEKTDSSSSNTDTNTNTNTRNIIADTSTAPLTYTKNLINLLTNSTSTSTLYDSLEDDTLNSNIHNPKNPNTTNAANATNAANTTNEENTQDKKKKILIVTSIVIGVILITGIVIVSSKTTSK
jgi:hypothetical protein